MSVVGKALDLPLLWRILGYSRPYKLRFNLTLSLTLALAVIGPLRPYIVKITVDDYIMNSNYQGLLNMTLLMAALIFIEAIFQFIQVYSANWLGQTIIKDLRLKTYNKIIGFKLKYFDKTPIGTLVTRTVSDIETIAEIFSSGILIIIGDLLKIIVVIGWMIYLDWQLTIASLISLPLLIVATNIFKNAIKSSFQDVRTQISNLNSFVQEHVTGMNIVQIFNREEEEAKKFHKINALHRDANIRSIWAYSIFFPVVELLSALSLAMMIWWGTNGVLSGQIQFGDLTAFILYIHMLYRPIRQLADRFNTLQMGMVSSERVFKVLDDESQITQAGNESISRIRGDISFKDVWFAYNEENWVLKGLSLEVKSGESLALVGATGAGKTSVINLLSRFYEFSKGSIELDGKDIRNINTSDLRKQVGVVLQDVFLFSDTVHNNITINNNEITREQVIEAAKAVGAHDFILKLPGGYDHNVRERGAMLSAGQRQLISFIRAYVYNPAILILDEATSSIDTESEEIIQHAIGKLTEKRTSIIIAHRLATIQKATNILVLDNGKVVERGSHSALLAQNGVYKNLFELQIAE
ncbi:MAG: ABC transporter ATP-binding protein [Flavobacteriales bacterium]|nr:ABC transporter ATP-binding protein [Flavobacteriales bacterium]